MLLLVSGDTDASIRDPKMEEGVLGVSVQRHLDGDRSGARKLDGIANQVDQTLDQSRGVGLDLLAYYYPQIS